MRPIAILVMAPPKVVLFIDVTTTVRKGRPLIAQGASFTEVLECKPSIALRVFGTGAPIAREPRRSDESCQFAKLVVCQTEGRSCPPDEVTRSERIAQSAGSLVCHAPLPGASLFMEARFVKGSLSGTASCMMFCPHHALHEEASSPPGCEDPKDLPATSLRSVAFTMLLIADLRSQLRNGS